MAVRDRAQCSARPHPHYKRLGLYHYAILLPTRAALGQFVAHIERLGVRAGQGDHDVSEAFYLKDPDGLGIEVYADRPRDQWVKTGNQLSMGTGTVDVASLLNRLEHRKGVTIAQVGGALWLVRSLRLDLVRRKEIVRVIEIGEHEAE